VSTDQYHEPAGELSQKTRTFARMITALVEEAEAIGWYEQRISLEKKRSRSCNHDGCAKGRIQTLLDGSRVSTSTEDGLAKDPQGRRFGTWQDR
jgi:EncFtn-like ferroxidase